LANITFVIGNGFDLCVGLKTRYTDFYREYTKEKVNDSELIRKFKEIILEDKYNNWADFELGMGQCREFNGKSGDFIACLDDFVISLNDYLNKECSNINWEGVNYTILNEFTNSIVKFRDKINSTTRTTLEEDIKNVPGRRISVLQLNYTNVFDTLFQKAKANFETLFHNRNVSESYGVNSLGYNLHIHGELDNHPLIGVSSNEQIFDEQLKFNSDISKVFIKPEFFNVMQNRNLNDETPPTRALKIIEQSSVIVTFGASIGDTDGYWWKIIGEWLTSKGKRLIIFDVCGEKDDGVSPLSVLTREKNVENKRTQISDRFAHLSGWTSEQIDVCREKVIIELDSSMFDFILPKKEFLE